MAIYTLKNGVRVFIKNMPHTQSVAVGAFVNTGSQNESKRINGISHFLEHMAFKGTKRRNYMKISQDVERLGADINAYTDKDMTAYFVSGMASHMPIFVDLIGDIFCNSILPADEIERERGVVLQEYKRYLDNPGAVASFLYDSTCYPDHAFGRKVLGEPVNINNLQRQDFLDYIEAQYTGPNVIVGVVGNVDEHAAMTLIEKHFASLKNKDPSLEVSAPEYVGGVAVKKKAVQQVTAVLGFETANNFSPSRYATHVAIAAFGHGMSSPLFNEIREKRGLVYSVGAEVEMRDNCGTSFIQAGTTPEHLDEFFNVTCDLLLSHTEKVSTIDLERAKNSLCVQMIRGMERPFGVLQSSVSDIFTYSEVLNVEDEIKKIQAVTPAQVKKVFSAMLKSTPTMAIVGKGADDRFYDQVKKRLS